MYTLHFSIHIINVEIILFFFFYLDCSFLTSVYNFFVIKRPTVKGIRKTVNLELGKEIEKDLFSSNPAPGRKKEFC